MSKLTVLSVSGSKKISQPVTLYIPGACMLKASMGILPGVLTKITIGTQYTNIN